jgi:urease accessory protein
MIAFPSVSEKLVRLQRSEGVARLGFRHDAASTRLETLYQEGCSKIRLPRGLPGQDREAILINTSGGLAGGDRVGIEIDAGERSAAVITSQACERVYRSIGPDAVVENRLTVGAGARLAWLPQETIMFEGGRLSRRLEADLRDDAELLAIEAVVFGRTAMGEVLRHGALLDRWRVRRDGTLIFAEDFRICGDIAGQLDRVVSLGGCRAMATILLTAPGRGLPLEAVRDLLGERGGASAWEDKLVVRIAASSGLVLRQRLEPVLSLLLGGQPLPKVWHL